ncbi:hypothetical protein TTHERM_01050370 (macronuclear) [Tetrahymena thermophila SB210]|uniref:Uncharacterized protein n=1 Tax=Tetrahymena thermophila (strain SB210) TaxID=312017 RepID=Q22XL9_TETTS|nr:hypothetical protein TTHERM_01050370 [Tetrahymena thermophila SB210]EAR89991.1 hypothetical protein TTHERM_01050370 [Tetrahymena thermophila SB210]|eukprot:XP_001010236.1 hypothetical protein TTHERM_01050370 [Tetrahymena thermophila SB210]
MSLILPSDVKIEIKVENSQENQEKYGIQLKKQIAKFKKCKSKTFKQQNFVIFPLYENRYIFNHQFIIHGYIQIETLYKDFNSVDEPELIVLQHANTGISSIVNNHKQKMIELNIDSKFGSGLKDFQFLVDYFNQSHDVKFKQLGAGLQEYQNFVSQKKQQFLYQNGKLKARIISEEEILLAIQDNDQYLDNYVKNNYDENDLLFVVQAFANFEENDIQIKKYKASYSLLEFMGIDINIPSQLKALQQLTQSARLYGADRIEEIIIKLKFYSEAQEKIIFEKQIVTVDQICLKVEIQVEFVSWLDKPEFLQSDDVVGYILKIQLQPQQLDQLKQIRASKCNQVASQINSQTSFETEVYQEIFIDKFYSNKPEIIKRKRKNLNK